MMVLWNRKQLTVKELGESLYLDSGTLTPLLKKMESQGFVIRERSIADERNVVVSLAEKGEQLRDKAVTVPVDIGSCIQLTKEDARTLYDLLYKLINNINHQT